MKYFCILTVFLAISLLALSCGPDTCGDGQYKCLDITSTLPYQSPIKYNDFANLYLFANGDLVQGEFGNGIRHYVNLKQLCNCDTICDIAVFDEYPYYREDLNKPNLAATDIFYAIALSPLKATKIRGFGEVINVFGNAGPDSTRFINAQYCAINEIGDIYIADKGDSSIKVYDFGGNFIKKWSIEGEPFQLQYNSEKLYFLDKLDNTIKYYDAYGTSLGNVSLPEYFMDITAFTFFSDYQSNKIGGIFWVADRDGARLTGFYAGGQIYEVKTGYCYQDVSIAFNNIIYLAGNDYSGISGNLSVVEFGSNMIISLGYRYYP